MPSLRGELRPANAAVARRWPAMSRLKRSVLLLVAGAAIVVTFVGIRQYTLRRLAVVQESMSAICAALHDAEARALTKRGVLNDLVGFGPFTAGIPHDLAAADRPLASRVSVLNEAPLLALLLFRLRPTVVLSTSDRTLEVWMTRAEEAAAGAPCECCFQDPPPESAEASICTLNAHSA